MNITYFDKPLLVKANNEAIRQNRNRSIDPEFVEALDDEIRFPVVFSIDHNDVERRVKIMLSSTDEAWLDISYEMFNSLPSVTMPTH